jgi:uncharacterized protein
MNGGQEVRALLCVFTRVPRLGRVKRRLAREVGDDAALSAHCRLVEDTLQRLGRVPGIVGELWIDAAPDARCSDWAQRFALPLRQQSGRSLGRRMQRALTDGLRRAPRVLLVGTDCPPIDAAYLQQAIAALDAAPVVLGPAVDGGYGLVGVRDRVPALFDGIDWGTARVLEQTLRAAARQGVAVTLLDEIWDVDDAAGWARCQAGWESRARD